MEFPTVAQIENDLAKVTAEMSQPESTSSVARKKELARQNRELNELLHLLRQKEQLDRQYDEAQALLDNPDEELRSLANEDLIQSGTARAELIKQIESLLLPHDPRDERDVILEIRAGAGGEEAALFASELFRAYARYSELKGWKVHTLSTSYSEQGGFKEIVAEITGHGVFGTLKFERGVHRVQRVPETEKQGRIHTSTITVAVLPQADEVDFVIKPEDLRIDTYRSGGAGGQHVNKTSSAIRITHIPTNTVVAVQDERSQHKNKDKAMSILRSRLLEAEEQARHQKEASERKAQVGTGDRSEKIRTYNVPQDRVTDHRIKESWSNIPAIMNGEWESIFTALQTAQRTLQLANMHSPISSI